MQSGTRRKRAARRLSCSTLRPLQTHLPRGSLQSNERAEPRPGREGRREAGVGSRAGLAASKTGFPGPQRRHRRRRGAGLAHWRPGRDPGSVPGVPHRRRGRRPSTRHVGVEALGPAPPRFHGERQLPGAPRDAARVRGEAWLQRARAQRGAAGGPGSRKRCTCEGKARRLSARARGGVLGGPGSKVVRVRVRMHGEVRRRVSAHARGGVADNSGSERQCAKRCGGRPGSGTQCACARRREGAQRSTR